MIVAKAVKLLAGIVLTMSVVAVYGDDAIKRIHVNDVELLCRIDKDKVDTISFSSVSNNSVVAGRDFLRGIDKVFTVIRDKNLRLSQELRLYLGCNLPLEMRQTLYQVISEHYARRFARQNYVISSSGREYAHKLIGRGYFYELDSRLTLHGYRVKSVYLEKVIVDSKKKVAVAFTDISLIRQTASGTTVEKGKEEIEACYLQLGEEKKSKCPPVSLQQKKRFEELQPLKK